MRIVQGVTLDDVHTGFKVGSAPGRFSKPERVNFLASLMAEYYIVLNFNVTRYT